MALYLLDIILGGLWYYVWIFNNAREKTKSTFFVLPETLALVQMQTLLVESFQFEFSTKIRIFWTWHWLLLSETVVT